jgi:hypothetical protein
MCHPVGRKPLILVAILSFTFIALLFFLQTISVQAANNRRVSSQLKSLVTKQTFALWEPGGISTPTWVTQTVDSSSDVGFYTSLALDSSDSPHISYFDGLNRELKYAMWNGSSWVSQTVDSGNVGLFTSLALDNSDAPHISYYNDLNDDLKYAMWNGSSWVVQTVDGSSSAGEYTSLTLDSSDAPHISYHDFANGDLKYAMWNGSSWVSQTVDSSGFVGQYTSLALDSSDIPHISYYDLSNNYLKYAMWNGSSWVSQTVDSSGGGGLFISLALDSSDAPHISYYGIALKYAMWNGSSWVIQTPDSSGSVVGRYTSLALDSSDTPHISYYDAGNGDLKYAIWNGTSWVIQTVDSGGDVGSFTSLALDSDGRPNISYHDSSRQELKIAQQRLTAVISPSGGNLNLPNLGTVSFPGNAFSETVEVTYTPLEDLPGLPDIGIYLDLDAVYASNGQSASIEAGQSFTMTLTYSNVPLGLDERTLIIVNWMAKLRQAAGGIDLPPGWSAETTVVDTETNTVTAVVDHFGVFSVFGEYTTFLPFTIKSSP